jgi:putative PIG3 family NAD(P)H quinone oxidoreductase
VLGLECAGVVAELGSDVEGFKVGDRVMALLGGGGYAERARVHESLVLPIPAGLSFEQAGAVPEAFLTAHEALLAAAELAPGERVLIHGAAGGVGSAAMQLARELGAFVFATTRDPAKLPWLAELGADRAIDTSNSDFADVIERETNGRGVDVIVDFVGSAYAERNQKSLATAGRWVVVGLLGGARASIDFGRLLQQRQTLRGIVMRTRSLTEKAAIVRAFRRDFLSWFDGARLSPRIDSVFPLAEVRAAHERMEANLNLGKIVLRVA